MGNWIDTTVMVPTTPREYILVVRIVESGHEHRFVLGYDKGIALRELDKLRALPQMRGVLEYSLIRSDGAIVVPEGGETDGYE